MNRTGSHSSTANHLKSHNTAARLRQTGYTEPSVSAGFSLLEMLIALSIVTAVGAAVFTALSQVLLFSTQDEISQNLRDDLLLTMGRIRKDLHISTNVLPKTGNRISGGTVIVLRQPVLDAAERIVDDSFQFVSYSILPGPPGEGGLLREVWPTEDAGSPSETVILNDSIVALGFLYGGKTIQQVANLTAIRDIEVILVSARETGLQGRDGDYVTVSDFYELEILNELLDYGLEFPYLRMFLDYINASKVDVVVSSSMGTATLRNRKSLGRKTVAEPILSSM